MATYGASIPAKVFRQFGYVNYTRHGLAHVLARALDYVGMRFCDALAPYNILDPALAESADASHTTAGRAALFVFDYPTSETFSLRFTGEATDRVYRPCVVMSLAGSSDSAIAEIGQGAQISFHAAFRPDRTNFGLSDVVTYNSLRASPAVFNGLADSLVSDSTTADVGRYFSFPALASWRPTTGAAYTTATALLQVLHLCVYLGPGGLMLCGGGNDQTQDRDGLTNLWNTWFIFGGKRIPNRARLPINDPDLAHICPVMQVFGDTNANSTWNPSGTAPSTHTGRMHLLAIQSGTRNSLADGQVAHASLTAFDFTQYVGAYSSTFPTRLSPVVVSSIPRNILSALQLVVPTGAVTVGPGAYGKYYPTTDDGITSLATVEDSYYCDDFRTSDPSLPMGEVTDPDTSIKWWGHWWNDANSMAAFKLGASYATTSTLPTKGYSSATTHTWNFAGVSVSDAVDVPAGAGIPAVANVDFFFASGSAGAWAQVPGQDYFESVISTGVTSQPAMDFTFDWPTGVDPTYQVELTFSSFLRGGTENSGAFSLILEVESVSHSTSTFVVLNTLVTSGANTGHASYNYIPRSTFRIPVGALTRNGKIRFRIRHARTAATGTNPVTARFGGISLAFRKWQ